MEKVHPQYRLFRSQRNSARSRKIEFQFTFEQWLAWWGDDIVNRGCRRGQLVMARLGDQGPYHPDNVRKLTMEDNIKEALSVRCYDSVSQKLTGRVFTEETREKMKLANPGISDEKRAKMIAGRRAYLAKIKQQKENI